METIITQEAILKQDIASYKKGQSVFIIMVGANYYDLDKIMSFKPKLVSFQEEDIIFTGNIKKLVGEVFEDVIH